MPPALTPLESALTDLLDRLSPVLPESVSPGDACGLILAADVVLKEALPARSMALVDGIAVLAADTVGAGPQGPVFLPAVPKALKTGEPLPEGTDAVLPAGALESLGGIPMLLQQAWPGEGVRLRGGDLKAGALLASAGQPLAAAASLALELAGETAVAVRRPLVGLVLADAATRKWLTRLVAFCGGRIAQSGEVAHLLLTDARDGFAARCSGLALAPGFDSAVGEVGQVQVIRLPPRFDGAIAVALALLSAALAKLTDAADMRIERPLSARLVSQVGLSEVALLRLRPDGFQPLSVGEITLASLLAATHAAIIPPASEGLPAGAMLVALSLPVLSGEM